MKAEGRLPQHIGPARCPKIEKVFLFRRVVPAPVPPPCSPTRSTPLFATLFLPSVPPPVLHARSFVRSAPLFARPVPLAVLPPFFLCVCVFLLVVFLRNYLGTIKLAGDTGLLLLIGLGRNDLETMILINKL